MRLANTPPSADWGPPAEKQRPHQAGKYPALPARGSSRSMSSTLTRGGGAYRVAEEARYGCTSAVQSPLMDMEWRTT